MTEDGFNTPDDLEIGSKASESAAGSIRTSGFNLPRLWARVHIDNYNAQKNGGEYIEKLKKYLTREYPSFVGDLANATITYKLKELEVHMIFKFKGLESKLDYIPLTGVDIPRKVLNELEEANDESAEAQLNPPEHTIIPTKEKKKKRAKINYSNPEDSIPPSSDTNLPEISLETRLAAKNAVQETRRRLMGEI